MMANRETNMPWARATLLIGFAIFCHLAATALGDDKPAAAALGRQPARNAPASKATTEDEIGEQRSYPSLPGAVRRLPDWLTKNAPFDVVRYFVIVPPDENAAPLYLAALYEFAPQDMAPCVSPEEHEARGPALLERAARTVSLQTEGAANADDRAAYLAEYRGTFEKLAEAQKRKRCVFETGLGIDTRLPHAQASRTVVRLLDRRVEMHVGEGSIDAALDDVEIAFRLGRDLRPRGSVICQLISIALDSVTTASLIQKILGAPQLTSDHCDRLLQTLMRHVSDGANPLTEGFRTEYLMIRDLLHRLELKEPLGDAVGIPGTSNGIVVGKLYGSGAGSKSLEIAEQIDDALAVMTAADFAKETDALNRYFRPLVEQGSRAGLELDQLLPDQIRAFDESKLAQFFVDLVPTKPEMILGIVEAARRNTTRLGATQCLVALRRWQIKRGKEPPPDLLTICKAAGMKAVPVDYYSESREPLRLLKSGADSVVYSVARDGKDDKAELDWNWGQTKGDWIFRLPPLP
jgi:hypothetical protein